MNTGLILLACGLVGLAIAFRLSIDRLSGPSSVRCWTTRDLYSGDLHALAAVARGRLDPTYDQIDRLKDRGFVTKGLLGYFRVTIKGYIALSLWKTVARTQPYPPKVSRRARTQQRS